MATSARRIPILLALAGIAAVSAAPARSAYEPLARADEPAPAAEVAFPFESYRAGDVARLRIWTGARGPASLRVVLVGRERGTRTVDDLVHGTPSTPPADPRFPTNEPTEPTSRSYPRRPRGGRCHRCCRGVGSVHDA